MHCNIAQILWQIINKLLYRVLISLQKIWDVWVSILLWYKNCSSWTAFKCQWHFIKNFTWGKTDKNASKAWTLGGFWVALYTAQSFFLLTPISNCLHTFACCSELFCSVLVQISLAKITSLSLFRNSDRVVNCLLVCGSSEEVYKLLSPWMLYTFYLLLDGCPDSTPSTCIRCVQDAVAVWWHQNWLKLNSVKTEI